jgi:hypothetical protein
MTDRPLPKLSSKANICVLCGYPLPTKTPTGATAVMQYLKTEECEAVSPEASALICTREPGHRGKHAACGFIAHPSDSWK